MAGKVSATQGPKGMCSLSLSLSLSLSHTHTHTRTHTHTHTPHHLISIAFTRKCSSFVLLLASYYNSDAPHALATSPSPPKSAESTAVGERRSPPDHHRRLRYRYPRTPTSSKCKTHGDVVAQGAAPLRPRRLCLLRAFRPCLHRRRFQTKESDTQRRRPLPSLSH